MSKNMDTSVDACDNFYQFACGGWMENKGIPTDKDLIDISTQLELDSEMKWRKILDSEGAIIEGDEDSAEWKIKTFYKLCLHDYGRMKNAGRTLVDTIRNAVGEWYVLDPENWQSQWNADRAIEMAHKEYNLPVFFYYRVRPDTRDVTRNILMVRRRGAYFTKRD